jgi:uncharacterized protein YuzE
VNPLTLSLSKGAISKNGSRLTMSGMICLIANWVVFMKIRYFADTDTMLIAFRDAPVAETRDLDENTLLDVDTQGNICSIKIEHASTRADAPRFSYEQAR